METSVQKTSTEPQTIQTLLEQRRVDIQQMLPSHIDVNRFIKSALLAVARNQKLKQCTPVSLFTAVVNAAELGLDFTPAKGHAYLVPYANEATFMPGYRGLCELAIRGGKVAQIWAYIVYEKDEFSVVYGTYPVINHVPKLTGDKGKTIGAYAVAKFHDGTVQFEFMDYDQIMAIKKRSKAANNGPWVTDEGEMIRKTTIRRLFKYIPSSPDLERAIELDNDAVGVMVDADVENEPGISRTSRLANMIGDTQDEPRIAEDNPPQKSDTPSPDTQMYGQYVSITKADYDSLIAKFGTELTDKAIDELNVHLEQNEGKRDGDHFGMLSRNLNKRKSASGNAEQGKLI